VDIGNQQRVIIVEPEKPLEEEPVAPAEVGADLAAEMEKAVAWPLPLQIDPALDTVG